MRFRAWFLFVFLLVDPLNAQTVRLAGHGEADLDALIREVLHSNALIITRDTTVRKQDTIAGDVIVLRARFILEGTVAGNLAGFSANMYLRPGARVSGRIMNVAGGYYPSELAKTDIVEDRPLAPYRVIQEGNDYTIEGLTKRPKVHPLGGVQIPEYNRVDGLRVEAGPSIDLPAFAGMDPVLSASIGYATKRQDVLSRVHLDLKRGRSNIGFAWEDDITETNEEWIRKTLKNSIATLWNGKDTRDYYLADRVFLEFHRILEQAARTSEYWIRAQHEVAQPLVAQKVFSVFKPDSVRPNLFVPSNRVTSLLVGARSRRTASTSAWDVTGQLEFAARVLDSDHSFNAYRASILYATKAIANHTLEIEGYFRGPLPGTEDLPEQRWTFVGGSGTLYTYEVAQFRGDRLAFIETEYTIPFAQRLTFPILGAPRLRLMHNVGMAWTRGEARRFEQNVGVRLQFALAYVRFLIDPRTSDSKFNVGVSVPGQNYPWEKPTAKRR